METVGSEVDHQRVGHGGSRYRKSDLNITPELRPEMKFIRDKYQRTSE